MPGKQLLYMLWVETLHAKKSSKLSLPQDPLWERATTINPGILIHWEVQLSEEEGVKGEGWAHATAPGGGAHGSWMWHLIQTELK